VPEFNKMSLASAFYSDRVIIRRFLVAMLDLRLGNAKAAIERASALGAQPDSDSLGSLTRDYSATITASLAAAKRDPAAVLKVLETQRFIVLGYRFIYPFHSHGVARLLRASALAQTGREDEALGWLDGLMTPESSVLDRQFLRAPAYRMAGEIHDRRGDRQAALEAYGRFVELWRDGDPAAQEQVKAVQERMGVLAAEPRT
jgi:tetratricopeptide (TPR) repeat protein